MKKVSSKKETICQKIYNIKNAFDKEKPNLERDDYSNSKVRNSGLEIYRIILMILIIAHHYVVNSGLMNNVIVSQYDWSFNNIFLVLFGGWGKIGINCFVLITGFFMCKSNITLKKFLRILLEVLFYNVILYIIFLIFGYIKFDFKEAIKIIIPIYDIGVSFTSSYLVFYLFIPFINILIRNLNKLKHLLLIALTIFIYTILTNFAFININLDYVWWFTVLYFIASYLRLYPIKSDKDNKKWLITTIVLVVLDILSILCCFYIKRYPYFFVANSNKLLALLTGISSFMLFKNINFKSKVINFISSSIFGVLLIHANSDVMRKFLWADLLDNVKYYNSDYLILHAFLAVIIVFVVCTIIDIIRIYTIEKSVFIKYDKLINKIKERRIDL